MNYFSIIIPVKSINDYIRETIEHIISMSSPNWEVWIITDTEVLSEWPHEVRIKVKPSGIVGPADKRDLGASLSAGNVLVFLDDDSYPQSDFLIQLNIIFSRSYVNAVGGPGITPIQDGFWEQVSGATYESKFMGSDPRRYRSVGKSILVDDWPTVNFSIRKECFLAIGGFNSKYWPGEDTEFCRKLIKEGYQIWYDPSLIVFHHRRPGIGSHLKQIGGYGIHRGYFARYYPENSRKLKYFLPTFFDLYLLLVVILSIKETNSLIFVPALLYMSLLLAYFTVTTLQKGFLVAIASSPLVFVSHIWYGFRFFQGYLLTKSLRSKLRP